MHESPTLHPVVEAYAHVTEPLLAALRKIPEPRGAILQTMLDLRESLSKEKPVEDALRAALSITPEEIDKADPNLAIMFLCLWANVSFRQRRLPEQEALIHRAKSLVTERTPPEIACNILEAEAMAAGGQGDLATREGLTRQYLSILDRSPRRKIAAWDLALLLGRLGRGTELENELKWLEGICDESFKPSRVALARFFNAFETGQVAEALRLIPQVESDTVVANYFAGDYHERRVVLASMCREVKLAPPPPSLIPTPKIYESAGCVARLLQGDVDGALRLARLDVESLEADLGFHTYNLIRAELAGRHGEAAQRLLLRRQDRGTRHYLDDLFLARVEWLAGNRAAAGLYFARVLKAVDQYQARGRLNFELRLATELSPNELVELACAGAYEPPGLPAPSRLAPVVRQGVERLIGRSTATDELRALIKRYAPLATPVLITGETGTGKELIARALHEAGPRHTQPFIAVNCGAIPESLLESELFGHARGAFTGAFRAHRGFFEEAVGGTLLLDEIGEIPPRLQVALLRILETGEVRPVGSNQTRKANCRIIAATNADLKKLADEGHFRKDLFYRLSRLTLQTTPLRQRRDDVLSLVDFFLAEDRTDEVRPIMTQGLKEALLRYDWPGNVRELRHCIERMRLTHSDKRTYEAADLDIKLPPASSAPHPESRPVAALNAVPPAAPDAPPQPLSAPSDDSWTQLLLQGKSALRRRQRLRALFLQQRMLTRSEIATMLKISSTTATQDLKALCAEGFLSKIQPSASPRSAYFVLRDAAATADEKKGPGSL